MTTTIVTTTTAMKTSTLDLVRGTSICCDRPAVAAPYIMSPPCHLGRAHASRVGGVELLLVLRLVLVLLRLAGERLSLTERLWRGLRRVAGRWIRAAGRRRGGRALHDERAAVAGRVDHPRAGRRPAARVVGHVRRQRWLRRKARRELARVRGRRRTASVGPSSSDGCAGRPAAGAGTGTGRVIALGIASAGTCAFATTVRSAPLDDHEPFASRSSSGSSSSISIASSSYSVMSGMLRRETCPVDCFPPASRSADCIDRAFGQRSLFSKATARSTTLTSRGLRPFVDRGERARREVRRGDEHLRGALSRVHGLAGDQREERRTDRPDVRLRVDLRAIADRLLGRHEARRAEEKARRRLLGAEARLHLREAEVEDLEAPFLRDEEVVRLDVAMDDALLVRRGEHVEELLADLVHVGERKADRPSGCDASRAARLRAAP